MTLAIDLSRPKYDQSTFVGRARHFFRATNPFNLLASDAELDEAKEIVTEFKKSRKLPPGYSEARLWSQKYLYDSAFHPDTGEKMLLAGRMSAQVPVNTLITGCMVTFYKSNVATTFWQWFNQTFNAVVNYSNRSGDAPLSKTQLVASYLCACGGAMSTALYLNRKVKHMNPLWARFVPFVAVSGANCINIPMMRSHELIHGTPVFTPDGATRLGESSVAARKGIFLVWVSRIFMAIPPMTLTPLLTNYVTTRGLLRRGWLVVPFQLSCVALTLSIATPLGCALFDQQCRINVESLETGLKDKIKKEYPDIEEVVFNKGL